MDYTVSRRVNLLRDCKEDGVDGLLVTHPVNVRYLTGFTGSSGSLVLSAKHAILVSDARYEEQIKEECKGLDVHIRPHTKTLTDAMAEVLSKSGLKTVGVEADHMSLITHTTLQEKAAKTTFAPLAGKRSEERRVGKECVP